MTDHHAPTDPPMDDGAAAVDQRLTAAVRAARNTTRPPDRHAFLARARIRRDKLRRRRRTWTIAAPIVAAAVVLVAIGVIATGGDNTSMNASKSIGASSPGMSQASTLSACPVKPGDPNVAAGEPLFNFTPTALVLCTYAVDGQLVKVRYVPGSGTATVTQTLADIRRDHATSEPASGVQKCSDDGAVAVNRAGVIATEGTRPITAWLAISTCAVPDVTPGPDGAASFHGDLADVQISPSDDSMLVRVRPAGSASYGEPRRIDSPSRSDGWTDNALGLDDATVHVIALAEGASLADAHGAAELAVGTARCGRFECLVYEVPRDRPGPTPTLTIASGGRTSSVTLDSTPVGAGVLRFEGNG